MTRRHFRAVAWILRTMGSLTAEQRRELACAFSSFFAAEDTARFDRGRFLAACGVEANE